MWMGIMVLLSAHHFPIYAREVATNWRGSAGR
jgi:hypothetical protein